MLRCAERLKRALITAGLALLLPIGLGAQPPARADSVSTFGSDSSKGGLNNMRKSLNKGNMRLGIEIAGMKGIVRTHPKALLREMNVTFDDSISMEDVEAVVKRNEELIYNTGQFNRVKLSHRIEDGKVKLDFDVAERWYIWPEVILNLEDRSIQAWLRNPDFQRITYGLGLNWYNFTGRFDKISLNYTRGFTERYSISYDRPFVFPKAMIGGGVSFQYLRNNEVLYNTEDGFLLRYRAVTQPLLQTVQGRIHLRKRFTQNHGMDLALGYRNIFTSDSLEWLNPNFLTSSNNHEFFSINEVSFWLDSRDVRPFPLHGERLVATLEMMGLVGPSSTRFNRLNVRYFRYRRVGQSRFYSATGAHVLWLMGGRVPYNEKFFLQQANVRGFDAFSIDASFVAVGRGELRYEVLKRKILTIRQLPRQFRDFPFGIYPFVFGDIGVAGDNTFNNADPRYKNRLLAGIGVGLDVPTFYDNIIRVEMATNNYGFTTILLNLSVALR